MKSKIKNSLIAGALLLGSHSFSQDPNCVYLASDVYPGSYGALPNLMTPFNGALYFTATGNFFGAEFWKYENGTSSMVADICSGVPGSLPNEFTVMGSDLYFSANNGTNGVELFKFDGTSVTLVQDINPGAAGSFPNKLTVVGSTLYFAAQDGVNGMEPWKYDGTTCTMVADIYAGANGSSPTDIEGLGTTVFFAASNPTYGLELWKYNGVTTTVNDIYPGTTGSDLAELTSAGTKMCFRATNGTSGYELWVHDGTTLTCLDANPGAADFTPWELTKVGTDVFCRGFHPSSGYELWKYNGTTASLVTDIYPGGNGHPNNLIASGTTGLYFAANNGVVGNELWYSDGTTSSLVADIRPGAASSMPVPFLQKFGTLGNEVFVVATNDVSGDEVWRYDGTTHELGKDIVPGTPGSAPAALKGVGNIMYFQADNGVNGGELWAWDITGDLTDTLTIYTCNDYTSPGGTFYPASSPGTYNFTDILTSVQCPGCDSLVTVDLTITDSPGMSYSVTACNDWTSPGGAYYNVDGNYTVVETFPSVNCPGIDSIIEIDLTIVDGVSTAVVVFTNVILAQQSGATYQWLDCDNGYAVIPGATNQDFLPVADGNYAVELTLGCTDTSGCYFVEGTPAVDGLTEKEEQHIRFYPNPANDMITVEVSGAESISVQVFDGLGKQVLSAGNNGGQLKVDLTSLARGTYFIGIQSGQNWSMQKLIKQ